MLHNLTEIGSDALTQSLLLVFVAALDRVAEILSFVQVLPFDTV